MVLGLVAACSDCLVLLVCVVVCGLGGESACLEFSILGAVAVGVVGGAGVSGWFVMVVICRVCLCVRV